jgi:hypothetical protein
MNCLEIKAKNSPHRPPAAVDGARTVWARGFEDDFGAGDGGIDLETNFYITPQAVIIKGIQKHFVGAQSQLGFYVMCNQFLVAHLDDAERRLADIRTIRADDCAPLLDLSRFWKRVAVHRQRNEREIWHLAAGSQVRFLHRGAALQQHSEAA